MCRTQQLSTALPQPYSQLSTESHSQPAALGPGSSHLCQQQWGHPSSDLSSWKNIPGDRNRGFLIVVIPAPLSVTAGSPSPVYFPSSAPTASQLGLELLSVIVIIAIISCSSGPFLYWAHVYSSDVLLFLCSQELGCRGFGVLGMWWCVLLALVAPLGCPGRAMDRAVNVSLGRGAGAASAAFCSCFIFLLVFLP